MVKVIPEARMENQERLLYGASLALRRNLEAIYHRRFSLIKSFLSVTKLQLVVPHTAQFIHHLSSVLPRAKNFPNSLC
jgi:hypothetical protein